MGADGVQLRTAGRVLRLRGQGIADLAVRLLPELDGRSTPDQLAQRLSVDPSLVERIVGSLHEKGVVYDQADPGEPGRWEETPALELYAELGADPLRAQAAVSASRVAFVGLGPVGRLSARHLAQAGVGAIALVDDGPVTAVDQSVLASEPSPVGRLRADVVAAECAAAGGREAPAVSVEGALEPVLEWVDLVVVEVDEAGLRAEAANRACLGAGVPFLPHSETSVAGVVGPLVQPFDSACYECLVQRRVAHLRHYDEHVAYLDQLRQGGLRPWEAALVAGAASLLAGLVSLVAQRALARSPVAATTTGVVTVDLRTLEVGHEEVLPVPGCPACGSRTEEVRLPR